MNYFSFFINSGDAYRLLNICLLVAHFFANILYRVPLSNVFQRQVLSHSALWSPYDKHVTWDAFFFSFLNLSLSGFTAQKSPIKPISKYSQHHAALTSYKYPLLPLKMALRGFDCRSFNDLRGKTTVLQSTLKTSKGKNDRNGQTFSYNTINCSPEGRGDDFFSLISTTAWSARLKSIPPAIVDSRHQVLLLN